MGLTQKLGTIPLAILTDSSNNVGIGAAANASFKLQVTGATNLTGVLTLGSTISNGTFTYTLPSATGTLALTSALSGYLPLTGGTLTGALSGTSATFSSDLSVINTSNALLKVFSNTTSSPIADIELMRGTNTTWGADAYTDYRIRSSGGDLLIQSGESTVTSTRLTIASTGAATFSSSVTADYLTSNGGGQINTTTSPLVFFNSGGGGNAKRFGLNMTNLDGFKIYSLNDNGTTRKDNIIFANIDGNVGIATTTTTNGLLSLRANSSDTIALVFQPTGSQAPSAISNFLGTNQTFTLIGSNAYVTSAGNIARFNTSYAGCFIAFDEGEISFGVGTNGINPGQKMRISTLGKVTINPTIAGDDILNVTNTSSTGYGMSVQGGVSSNYSLTVRDYLGTDRFTVFGNGGVYAPNIGAASGTAMVLDSAGFLRTTTSSIRYKKDIKPIDIGLDFILSLNPVSYNLKNDNLPQVGFIAEDFPDDRLVSLSMIDTEDVTKGYQKESVNYSQIVAPLVKAIQELTQKVNALENR
jgi:hypothetical protein